MKKIIFTGKGGVGKTTIASTLARLLARDGGRVMVIDCDPSMNLAMGLGIPLSEIRPLTDAKKAIGEMMELETSEMIEEEGNMETDHHHHHDSEFDPYEVVQECITEGADGVKLLVMGTIPYGGSGCLCTSISLVKQFMNYITSETMDNDFLIIDSQAGVEIFGRGMARDFDLSLVITEPTPKSMEVARHGMKLAGDLGVKKQILVVNKIEGHEELENASRTLGDVADKIYSVGYDRSVVMADKTGLHLLDSSPQCEAVKDIIRIKEYLVI
jgi:CO dehydrogenase maturation factor